MNRSMNGNNLAFPCSKQLESNPLMQQRMQQRSSPKMESFGLHDSRPPIPIRRNFRKVQDTEADEKDMSRKHIHDLEKDLEQYKEKAEKFHILYERQRNLCEIRTEELLKLESKFSQLEKSFENQENLIINMNHEHDKLSKELKDRSDKLADTMNEMSSVVMKSEDLVRKLHEFERQLQISETARGIELENLRNLQGSFQASEKHFASVLEQVQSLIQENELAYETNCKLSQEKLRVERDLSLKNKMSSSLTVELAEAQEKMQQINQTLKSFEHEKSCLYRKMQEQQSLINKLESELGEKTKQMDAAYQSKTDLEGQLKLANLCLSRALSDKDKANILPQKSEVKVKEPPSFQGGSLPSYKVLQEDIATKDIIIGRLIEENNKLEDELQKCKMDLQKQQEINTVSHVWFKNIHDAPKDLQQEIQHRERIIDSMKVAIEKAISERNRLGLKCMRRKEQAVLLKEKNKVLEEIMLIGNRLYEEGLKKIRNMKMAQENNYGSTLSLVGIVSGSGKSTASSCRQIMMGERVEGVSASNDGRESAQNSGDSYDPEEIMNI